MAPSKNKYTWTRTPRTLTTNNDSWNLDKGYCEDCYQPVPCACWEAAMAAEQQQQCKVTSDDGRNNHNKRRRAAEPPFAASGVKNEDDDDEEEGTLIKQRSPNNKRRRAHGPDTLVMAFDRPFACAFGAGACAHRATCSYHHGVAEACECHKTTCPKGHAHRRAPRPCAHGSTRDCRWNLLLECSFHHGDPTTCSCVEATCPKAHLQRVRRNPEMRKQQQQRNNKNANRLFVGRLPTGTTSLELETCFNQCIQAAASFPILQDPVVVDVTMGTTSPKYAFVELSTAQLATACLVLDQRLYLRGSNKKPLSVERPRDYDPSSSSSSSVEETCASSSSGPPFHLDVGKLLLSSAASVYLNPAAKKKRPKKPKSHYQQWRKAQKTGETNAQKRQRYLALFPHGVAAAAATEPPSPEL